MTKVPLQSWRDTPARQKILDFVARVTRPGCLDYVDPADRVAVFDNDGSLWVEQPLYVQGMYALDRARRMKGDHPELAAMPAFQAFLREDLQGLAACGKQAVIELLLHLHAHTTEEAFARDVEHWLMQARHPRFDKPYPALAYLPMCELMIYLRANDFRTFISTAGGADFVRTFCERAYGVPRENVIGSSCRAEFRLNGDRAEIGKLPELLSFNEFAAKPVNIARHVGRRPILAVGNSDGDLAMLQYADSGPGQRLALLLHHDDPDREYAYDRDTRVGRLDVGLATAAERAWTVVSMKNDWSRLFRHSPR